ncbi:MAG TPA: MFS transporter [Verrucomicrobiae bacterium]|nr:MFS transporter [Verrucomicrobiae bacterium]
MSGARPRFREVLAIRNFRLLWIGQVIASIGDRFYQFALLYVVLKLSPQEGAGVGRESARVLFSGMCLTVLLTPWIGAFVDRHSRRAVMVFADLARAFLVLAMLGIWYATRSVPLIFGLIAVAGLMTGFFIPARQASIPLLVGPRQIVAANALVTTIGVIASLAGGCAGFLVAIFGERSSFLIAAVGFAISAVLVARIDRPLVAAAIEGEGRATWSDIWRTLASVWRDSVVRLMFLLNGISQFVAGLFLVFVLERAANDLDLSLLRRAVSVFARWAVSLGFKEPVVETRLLGLVLLLMALAAGLVTGVFVSGRFWRLAHWKGLPVMMLGALGLCFVGFSSATSFLAAAIGCAAVGAAGALLNIPVDARLQAHVPGASQGRLFAARSAWNYLFFLAAVAINLDGRLLTWRGAGEMIGDLGWFCACASVAFAIAFRAHLRGSWIRPAGGAGVSD